jgi:4-hydroxybenzoate polyprenyltransferase
MFRSYAQLVRLPNVFTALADICLGTLVALTVRVKQRPEAEGWLARHFEQLGITLGGLASCWPSFVFLLLASACFYMAGMVWNDVFDVEQDRRERPFRPIPSGRIGRQRAMVLGIVLSGFGLCFAYVAGWDADGWRRVPLVLGVLLVVAIFLYDGGLKRTGMGPAGMGACRFLNVLLGVSVLRGSLGAWSIHLALVVGFYIVGVTWFARTEARASNRRSLAGAAAVMLFALMLGLLLPAYPAFPPGAGSLLFPYLLVTLGFIVGLTLVQAIRFPEPAYVQHAVKRSIMGLVALDAILACGLAGEVGLLILLLLVPALYLGRWIYST